MTPQGQLVALGIAFTAKPFDATLDAVCEATGVSRADILSKRQAAPIPRARRLFIHELHSRGWSQSEIGRRLGMDASSVNTALVVFQREFVAESAGVFRTRRNK